MIENFLKKNLTELKYFTIPEEKGQRLDIFLAKKFPVMNRTGWQKRIRDGQVLLNGKEIRPSRIIHENEEIKIFYYKKEEPPVDENYSVIYLDDYFLAINKPPNLPVHPSGSYYKHTLHALLKRDFPDEETFRFTGRLDRETSGVILLARTKEAAHTIQNLSENNKIYKEYAVIVEGNFSTYVDAAGYLSDSSGPVHKKRIFRKEKTPDSLFARTEFFPVQTGEISLVKCILHTGRLHQIRATLHSLGYPVVGDRLYGIDEMLYLKFLEYGYQEEDKAILRMNRSALHCSELHFIHPFHMKELRLTAEIPPDMKEILL